MAYPTTLDDLTTAIPTGGSTDHEEQHTSEATAIEALEAKVGTGSSTATANTALVGTAAGVTAWLPVERKATVTLSSAQILDLHNTPVTLVAAPGAGKWLNVHRVSAYHDFGTTAYTTDDSNSAAVGVSGVYSSVVGNLTTTEDFIEARVVPQEGTTAVVNAAVQAFGNGTTFTLGDGTLTVTVWYTVEDVP